MKGTLVHGKGLLTRPLTAAGLKCSLRFCRCGGRLRQRMAKGKHSSTRSPLSRVQIRNDQEFKVAVVGTRIPQIAPTFGRP